MGNNHSFSAEELVELQKGTSFTEEQILKLHKRFRKLDRNGDGKISWDEFEAIPKLQQNPLLGRVLTIFDTNHDHSVDFREFVKALAIFSGDCAKEEKLKFTYKMYDIDGDNKISNRDLFQTLQIMVGSNLTDVQLQQIVDKTFIEADENRDGYIDFNEFVKVVEASDFGDKLTLQF
eukprot:Sspe_Gene.14171::Locus_4894_Transcript_1_1_Confidence_1.000_Length_659::g.14171::m.14171/K06268/PPP3R, CNB; serine/threonine-protein phosphatase 2B regulatory subunit